MTVSEQSSARSESTSGNLLESSFQAKFLTMKSWKPSNTPSNRDRLELYALHTQAVSGDAFANIQHNSSVADKAKFTAWRNKRGIPSVEAMRLYINECDRQTRVYGNKIGNSQSTSLKNSATTPMNTPNQSSMAASNGSSEYGSILTPRGLAAIPLLCAASSEHREAYIVRMTNTNASNGWWCKQEPLCADPGTYLAIPETVLLQLSTWIESLALSYAQQIKFVHSFICPIHRVFLALWVQIILVSTLFNSAFLSMKTLLYGAKSTGVSIRQIFDEEIVPCGRAARGLCEPHQAVTIRLTGLILLPLVCLCDVAAVVGSGVVGLPGGAVVFAASAVLTWWYWLMILPPIGFWLLFFSLWAGSCFSIIELAGS